MSEAIFYGYDKCSTCRKAQKFLSDKGVGYRAVDITRQPPKREELRRALAAGYPLKGLFNTSGQVYRERQLSKKLPELSQDESLDLLVEEGKLVKRPLFLRGDKVLVGFKEEQWNETLS